MPFTLRSERAIPEINATARLYTHDKTGARLLSLVNDDENKSFSINFRTPPADSTGIAHIMEHSVLCGSRKYPVKEPFIELKKGSLNTFLNAFTYPDKTCYPVASQNLKDFYNLVDVYLDAVLYPLISPETLQQEGWHYELEASDAPLTYKGVVFNEMKGNYSSPDGLLGDVSQRSLFPDNIYRFDSGGDPAAIPDLTYTAFKTFHDTYYHPSNAYIYFYGDDPEEERLRLLDPWLEAFDRKQVDSLTSLQPRFSAPASVQAFYDSGDTQDAKAYLQLNWLMPEVTDIHTSLALELLAHILLATPASPLKKVLSESGLGEDVTGGYQGDYRQAMFSAGLKGVDASNTKKVEKLILDTLSSLSRDGLDAGTVAASLNTVEFHLRERNTGRFPRGLALMLAALSIWVYDGDPLEALSFEAPLAALKDAVARGHFFEGLIEQYLLDNPHRVSVTLLPDPAEGARRAAAEHARLEEARAAMSPADREQVMASAAELKRRQETPDTPAALASIPALKLSDIDKHIHTIPLETLELAGVKTIFHPLFTNDILYLDLGFDLHALTADLLPYAGLFGRLLLEMGTAKDDFVRLTQRIGRDTGGIRPTSLISAMRASTASTAWLFLRSKAVASQSPALLDVLQDVLLSARLDNPERFKQIVLEEKAGMEAGLLPGGHQVVNRRLRARFHEADWIGEQVGGLDQLFFLRELADTLEKDWPSVLEKLETLRRSLLDRSSMIANVTVDQAHWYSLRPQLESFLASIPASPIPQPSSFVLHPSSSEGLTIPTQVNYVAKGADLFKLGYKLHGSVQVINKLLGTSWLWEKIRVQGGAYGGFSLFDIYSGVYTFLSYRDPNLLATLDNFDATAGFLRSLDLSAAELTKSIIGTIGDLDAYLLPDAKGWLSLTRHLIGLTDAQRQQFRDEVLATTPADFKAFGETLQALAQHGEMVVLGSAAAIEKANQQRPGLLEVKKVL